MINISFLFYLFLFTSIGVTCPNATPKRHVRKKNRLYGSKMLSVVAVFIRRTKVSINPNECKQRSSFPLHPFYHYHTCSLSSVPIMICIISLTTYTNIDNGIYINLHVLNHFFIKEVKLCLARLSTFPSGKLWM